MRVKTAVIVLLILANAVGLYADQKRWNSLLEQDDSPPGGKIVGGEEAKPYEFPWHVQIRYRGKHWCGGTILNARSILTAAHCLHNAGERLQKDGLEVYAREHNIYCLEGAEQRRDVESYRVHPDYEYHTLKNDIAIIRVKPAFKGDRFTKSIILPKKDFKFIENTTKAEIVGWGWLRYPEILYKDEVILPTAILRKVTLTHYQDFQCGIEGHAVGNPVDLGVQVCFGGGVESSCRGDSGGGAVCRISPTQSTLCGIVSWSLHCGEKGTPNFFVRLTSFIQWVETNSKQRGLQAPRITKCGSYFKGNAAVFDFKNLRRKSHCHIVIESDFVETTFKITGVFDPKDEFYYMNGSRICGGCKPGTVDITKPSNTFSLRGSSIIILTFRIAQWSFSQYRNITVTFTSKGARARTDPVTDLHIIDYNGEISYPEKDSGTEFYYNSRNVLLVFPRYYNGEYYEANFHFQKVDIDGGPKCDLAHLNFLQISHKGEFQIVGSYCTAFHLNNLEIRPFGILIIQFVSTPDAPFAEGIIMFLSTLKGAIFDSWIQ